MYLPISPTTHRATGRHLRSFLSHYKVYVAVAQGTEIPEFAGSAGTQAVVLGQKKAGEATKMCLKVQCGSFAAYSKPVHNHNGICEFFDFVEFEDGATFPKDLDQVPDIIVSVCKSGKGDPMPVSYKRFKFRDVFEKGEGEGGGKLKCEWETLREDKAADLLGMEMFPGSLLMRVGVLDASNPSTPSFCDKWKSIVTARPETKQYQLRCHIYQGADLPSVAPGILLDPFVKVNFNGEER